MSSKKESEMREEQNGIWIVGSVSQGTLSFSSTIDDSPHRPSTSKIEFNMPSTTRVSENSSSRVLREPTVRRENFDPKNKEHKASLKKFIETGNWGDVQFFAEYPYVTVPETVLRKFSMAMLTR